MAANYAFSRCLTGATLELAKATSGAAFAAGQPLVWSSGKLVKATGGTDTTAVCGVAAHAATGADEEVSYYPALPHVLFKTADVSAAPTLGTKYGLVATSLNLDVSNTTQTRLKVVGAADAEGKYEVIFLGWDA